nr:MAG TPA: Major tail protein [Caudoviricetes sp.]
MADIIIDVDGTKKRALTKFTFFYNTPIVNFNETIHFKNNLERDNFFLYKANYKRLTFDTDFNFIRDKGEVRIPTKIGDYERLQGINYCTFYDIKTGKRYYAYVAGINYINSGVSLINLIVDPIMTFTQGKVLNNLKNVNIIRQHLEKKTYMDNLKYLKKNDDIIKTYTKGYYIENRLIFKDFYVLIQSSADLSADFGNENKPRMKSSKGGTFDNITSPLSLYVVDYENFNSFTEKLSIYPWIAQNLKRVLLIPKDFINKDDLEPVINGFDYPYLFRLKNNKKSSLSKEFKNKLDRLSFNYSELLKTTGLKEDEQHLLRNNYISAECYNFNGGELIPDLSDLDTEKGLKFNVNKIIGYENEIAFYIESMGKNIAPHLTTKKLDYELDKLGVYLNNALYFNSFDDIPVLVDNYKLSMAKNANQRALTESKLVSNRINNVFDSNSSLQSRFYDSVSLLSNLSPRSLLGKFNDEYEYYRSKKAEYEDMKLQTPTITEQTNRNSFNINNGIFGLTMKIAKPDYEEFKIIKKYYKNFGFSLPVSNVNINDIESQTIMNYLQIKGNYFIDYVDTALMELLRVQLEQGVKFWHYDGSIDYKPNKYNILNNTWRD